MKKLLFLVSICLIGFYACKKSDTNNSPSNATKIVGKWFNSKSYPVRTKNGVDSIGTQNPTDSLYIQFNANLTGIVFEDGQNQAYTYTLSGNTLSLTPTNSPSESVNFNIKSLTSTDMVLRLQTDVEDGVTNSTDLYFTKQ